MTTGPGPAAPGGADLSRFARAQDDGGTYARALAELRTGAKRTHWMWFVFPQLAGLGRSATARHFALASLAEARRYLADPVLGARLRECAAALLSVHGRSAEQVLGPIDAVKLRSSMTLFERAAAGNPQAGDELFAAVLDAYFAGERDGATLRLLAQP